MKDHYEFLKNQFIKTYYPYFDGIDWNPECERFYANGNYPFGGIFSQASYISPFEALLVAYYLPGTPLYRDEKLLDRAKLCLEKYRAHIHPDGTVDFRMTNFHDPAETAFVFSNSLMYIRLVERYTRHTEKEDELFNLCVAIIDINAKAIAHLGFHTPNHRWVECAALAMAYRYTKKQEYLDSMNRFLSEGIDCDEHGEYTERSAGHYNIVCNDAFILLSLMLDDDSYLEYPRRNLELVYSFVEPDDFMMSLNSSRIDSTQRHPFIEYYHNYLYLSLKNGNGNFAYTADRFMTYYQSKEMLGEYYAPSCVLLFLLLSSPELIEKQKELISEKPRDDRSIFLPKSGIARIYKPSNSMTVSVMRTRQPTFLKVQKGSQELLVRFAGAFFGDPHSQFRAREIYEEDGAYRLVCHEEAGYRSQFDTPPETSDWRRMDHSKRHIINVQTFHTEITVRVNGDNEVELLIDSDGPEGIPTKLELFFTGIGSFESGSVISRVKPGDYFFLRDDSAEYITGNVAFGIKGGFCEHTYGEEMRGTENLGGGKFTVALTSFTPQKRKITLSVR